MNHEEFARCVQEAGERDMENFQMGIIMMRNMRQVMARYGVTKKMDQDAVLRQENASGASATLMQFCPAMESPDVLYVDENGKQFDALMATM